MDFMKVLKSIEELLYEVVAWFVFYPLTLWRIIRHPQKMMAFAEQELSRPDDPYDDSVSPPVLLLLTLVLLHALSGIWSSRSEPLPGFLADDINLLMFRSVAFSLIPMLFAVGQLLARGARLTRSTLKPAFHSQSFAAVPFMIAASIGFSMVVGERSPTVLGGLVIGVSTLWFLTVETLWLSRNTSMGHVRAASTAVATLGVSLVMLLATAAVVELAAGQRF